MVSVPIPARLAHRPTVGGLVQPWMNVALADGGVDFRSHHRSRAQLCWAENRCQVDGELLTRPAVLFGGPNQLRRLLFDEPALHPECAVYASKACPMVAGQLTHYAAHGIVSAGPRGQRCPDPDCDCGGWVQNDPPAGLAGAPAHPWYAVYVSGYTPAMNLRGELFGGVVHPDEVLKVLLVSTPGTGRVWTRTPLPDDLDPAILNPGVPPRDQPAVTATTNTSKGGVRP
jgi:hypothetical protein